MFCFQKYLPNNNSIIDVNLFDSPRELADHIKMLNNNDEKYNRFLDHKIHKKVSNALLAEQLSQRTYDTNSIVEDFECFVCQQSVENSEGRPENKKHEDICGTDLVYPKMSARPENISTSNILAQGKCEANLLQDKVLDNAPFNEKDFWNEIIERYENKIC